MSYDNFSNLLTQISESQMNFAKPIEFDSPLQHIFVDEQFEILKRYIQKFERTLDPQHEVGIMMTNFGQSIIMQVKEITYEKPVLLIFKGFVNGKMSTLIQHMNQLNFLLTSIEKTDEKPKNPIGFTVPSE